MDVTEIGRSATKGAINIFTGKIISRAIGIIGGIITVRILGPDNYGLLVIAISAPNILLVANDFGMDTATTKFLSEAHTKNQTNQMRSILYSGFIFKALLSFFLTLLCFLGAEIFASTLFAKSSVTPLIQIAATLVFTWTLSNFFDSVLLGLDLTRYNAIFMIISEILLSSLPILFVIFYAVEASYALIGMVIAGLITVFLQLLICSRYVWNKSGKFSEGSFKTGVSQTLRKSLWYGAPLQVIILVSTGLGQFYRFMLARFGTPFEVGNYSVAQNGNSIVDYLAWPISLVIFPMFSKIDSSEQSEGLKKLFKYSVKYSSLVILPAAVAVFWLGKPLISFLFGPEYEFAWTYLTLLSIGWLLYGFGSVHLRKLLLSQGDTRFLTIMDSITAAISVFLALVLVFFYGVLGLIVTTLLSGWPTYILVYRRARQKYGLSLPTNDLIRIYGSTTITALLTLPIALFIVNELLKLLLGLLVIITVYGIAILLTRAITLNDIETLRRMTSKSYLDKIIGAILNLMERVMYTLKLHRSQEQ